MNNIGKIIKYKVNTNSSIQTGIITDESINGEVCISGVWYNKNHIIIIEICENTSFTNEQLICG